MPTLENSKRFLPDNPYLFNAQDIETYPHINPQLIDRDRLTARKRTEEQQESGLFPVEEEMCGKLLDECREYMPDDVDKVRLALQFSLFGHQRQWRDSGEPYSIHPLTMAIEAAREYKADWQTVALCLLHDLAEDSNKHGHPVMPYQVAKAYKNIGLRKDGLILAEGMRALKKIEKYEKKESKLSPLRALFSRKSDQAEIDSVQKIYDAVLSGRSSEFGTARVILVKLLDRKHNMQTIKHLKQEKQIEKATETLHVYTNMAHAFGYYRLRDELFELSYQILYPTKVDMFVRSQDEILPVFKNLEEKNISEMIRLNYPEYLPMIWFSLPSLYEYFIQEQQDDTQIKPFLYWRFMIPKESGETVEQWRWRASHFFGAFISKYKIEPVTDITVKNIVSPDEKDGERLKAIFKIGGVTLRVEIFSDKKLLDDTVSLQDIYGKEVGGRQAAKDRLRQIREDFARIKKTGDVSSFFEAVGGGKIIFNDKGNPLHFPQQATLIDVLYTMLGDGVFLADYVHLRDVNGKRRIIQLHQIGKSSFGRVLRSGEQIEKVVFEVGDVSSFRLQQLIESLGKATFNSLKVKVAEEIVGILENDEYNEIYIQELQKTGEERISQKYGEACSRVSGNYDVSYFLKIPKNLLPVETIQSRYKDYKDFQIAVALDIVDEEVFASYIKALLEIRKEVLFIDLEFPDTYPYSGNDKTAGEITRIFQEMDIEYVEKLVAERHIQIYVHPKQLGNTVDDIVARYNELHEKLKSAFNNDEKHNSVKIYSTVPKGWIQNMFPEI